MMLGRELTPWQTPLRAITEMQREMNQMFSRFFGEGEQVGKRRTQQLERKHLTLRTRIKRLVRKTICFSRSVKMHDIVIGLFINRFEFGLAV